MEVAEYPAQPTQRLVSVVVLLTSLILFVRALGPEPALQDAASFLVLASTAFIALSMPQYREFREVKQAVMAGEPYVKQAGGEAPRTLSLALLLLAALLGPFVLSAYLQPGTWFSVVLGVISGFSASQLAFILYVGRWEKANGVKLEQYRVTRHGDWKIVVERGVRARR